MIMDLKAMCSKKPEVAVAGHICLDLIPGISFQQRPDQIFVPGRLTEIEGMNLSTGGAVSNTGLSLHHLGVPVQLMGKVGNDQIGEIILNLLNQTDPILTEGMTKAEGEQSSYTIVLNFPDTDRIFLHCPGTNHTFSAADVAIGKLDGIRLFHFGYPPLMKRMYDKDGEELVSMLKTVKTKQVLTSLDMTLPDGNSESSKVDWNRYLKQVLPYVDIFLPSLEEILYMLRRDIYQKLVSERTGEPFEKKVPVTLLQEIAEDLLNKGCRIAAIKMGELGIYLRTGDQEKIGFLSRQLPGMVHHWVNRELWMPCFKTDVAGTTGAGDSTIAGFLMGVLKNQFPVEVLRSAVAVGACCVEKADATSGILPWEQIVKRIENGWDKLPLPCEPEGFTFDDSQYVWMGPNDRMS